MSTVRSLFGRLDAAFRRPERIGDFAILRGGVAIAIGLRIALNSAMSAAAPPSGLFRPPLLLGWLSSPPDTWMLVGCRIVGVALAVAVVARLAPRATFRLLLLDYVFLAAIVSSQGKIRHNEVLLLLAAVPFAAAAIGRAEYRDPSESNQAGWPRRLALTVIVMSYAATGIQKLRFSGFEWATSENMRWVLYRGVGNGHSIWPSMAMFVASRSWLYHAVAAGALALECLLPFALVFRKVRPWFGLGAMSLHLFIWLFLGLDYSAWILAAGLLLLPWVPPVRRALARRPVVESPDRATAPTARLVGTRSSTPPRLGTVGSRVDEQVESTHR